MSRTEFRLYRSPEVARRLIVILPLYAFQAPIGPTPSGHEAEQSARLPLGVKENVKPAQMGY